MNPILMESSNLGILNTVVFLVSNVQQVCVFVVNLQGRPFMTGLTRESSSTLEFIGYFHSYVHVRNGVRTWSQQVLPIGTFP
jgi:hypothetical protein